MLRSGVIASIIGRKAAGDCDLRTAGSASRRPSVAFWHRSKPYAGYSNPPAILIVLDLFTVIDSTLVSGVSGMAEGLSETAKKE